MQLHPAGLDLGEIQDVVDQREQVPAGGVDLLQVPAELGVPQVLRLLLQHLAVADDRVERGPELVTHAGQKLALGAVGGLRLLARPEQLGDVVVQAHESHALAVHHHGNSQHLHIHQCPVLAAPSADSVDRAIQRFPRVLLRLRARDFGRDQLVQVLPDRLAAGVAEQPLEVGIAADDAVFAVERDDGHRAVLEQLLEILLLALRFGVEPRVLDRDRRLGREQVEQAHVLGAEHARRIRVYGGDGSHEPASDQERCGHHGVNRDVRVLGRAAQPLRV